MKQKQFYRLSRISRPRTARPVAGRYTAFMLSFLWLVLLLSLLSACSLLPSLQPAETVAPFSFTPAETPASQPLASTAGASDAAVEASQPAADASDPAAADPGELQSTTAVGNERPLYARAADEDVNEEPPVPLATPAEGSGQGVTGQRAERYFKTLSTDPVTYDYLVYPGDADPDEPVTEIDLSLSRGRTYMKLTAQDLMLGLLQINEGSYYQIDYIAKTYEELSGRSSYQKELSMEAFAQLQENARKFILTGRGEAIFYGDKVTFEEYTVDGASYVRYYFVGDALVGHRSFSGGQIRQTVRVKEVSNRYDESLFKLPQGFTKLSSEAPPVDVITVTTAPAESVSVAP